MPKDGELSPRRAGDRRRLGEILLADGVIDEAALSGAIAAQAISRARIGDILTFRAGADASAVASAAARQLGIDFADLRQEALDPGPISAKELDECLRLRIAPMRRVDGGTLYAAASPEAAGAWLTERGAVAPPFIAVETRALAQAMIGACGAPLALRSATRRPEASSLRAGFASWQVGGAGAAAAFAAVLAVVEPEGALALGASAAAVVMGLNGALWGAALLARPDWRERRPAPAPRLSDYRAPPVVTVLVALYREPETAPLLIRSLEALDYPPELLDIKLILEADDVETLSALRALDPPAHFEILVAPEGAPRTKPRALNFGLDFARGEIIGVYDAEDRPAPDQIRRIVAQFAESPPEIACLQARLGYYNTSENWLTRCFEIEYASWFDAMLPGLFRLGMPIPLGGTSLFVRRGALAAVGGWDSHNVTEDADLGMMLARAGLGTGLSLSLTEEEAASRPGAWIRQRSRWLKGYLSTWATHMRRPGALLADLGLRRFVGFNAVLLAAALGYLVLPWLWAASALNLVADLGDSPAGAAITAVQVAATLVLPVMFAAAVLGLWRRGKLKLAWLTLTLPAYWALGSVAAYLALWELVAAPSRWRKTQHGVGRIAAELRRDALGLPPSDP